MTGPPLGVPAPCSRFALRRGRLCLRLGRFAFHRLALGRLTRGGRRIARLVPAGPSKRVKVAELNALFAQLPSLDDDAEAFERDIADGQAALAEDRDPWR